MFYAQRERTLWGCPSSFPFLPAAEIGQRDGRRRSRFSKRYLEV
jgi:hypothetical protein